MEMKASNQDKDGYNISLNYKVDTIRVYKQAIEVLGNPKFVQFYMDQDRKTLYMVGTDEREKNALEVPGKEKLQNRCFVLHGLHFIRWVSRLAGWNLKVPHILRGNYMPEYNAISFDLSKAVTA